MVPSYNDVWWREADSNRASVDAASGRNMGRSFPVTGTMPASPYSQWPSIRTKADDCLAVVLYLTTARVTWLACADEWARPEQFKVTLVLMHMVYLGGRLYYLLLNAPLAQWLVGKLVCTYALPPCCTV
ncbi:hypothetical protein [Mesorhizobium sp.]|uniref:hypothetical protein n=1 Tax=Mesorhizobium sp. TaxID=1871066 RepID=UPI00257C74A6|nr:hypothetical protein [Mesorhizobium sp.]